MITPRMVFEENIRPAELLLRVYRLLECDVIETEGELVRKLRAVVGAGASEYLMLISNSIFVGVVREHAEIPMPSLKRAALDNLLRQAIVVACTALDTYLPSLLRANLATVIEVRGREFIPQDNSVREYFGDLTFDLSDTLRLLADPEGAPLFIANKILGKTAFAYLSNKRGIHVVGALLALDKPWQDIAAKLQRDRNELMKGIEETANRRNDIVHRADRPRGTSRTANEEITFEWAEQQEVSFSFAQQSVDTVKHVCLALDELVTARMVRLRVEAEEPRLLEGVVV